MEKEKIPIGCAIDEILGGGVERGIITEIYGEGGTGKTNICIQLARNCATDGRKVIFIDTEGVSRERIFQVCGDDKKIVEKILFFSPYSLQEQEEMVGKAVKIDSGLIIVDSLNLYYRLDMEKDEGTATRSLTRQLVNLQIEARKRNIPVVVTAQVYSVGDEVKPFGGRSIDHMVKAVIRLEKAGEKRKDGKEERLATLVKHRSQPDGRAIKFFITPSGVE
ncbi:MAG: DNA repair and recombination protein RadB [Thermoplasmata archaeon]|nr:MAG: DNA repair and recombination protein RadB [Thermoplasmata archaeon]